MVCFNVDGMLEMWFFNQVLEMFQVVIVKQIGLFLEKIIIYLFLLGGFFGWYFLYEMVMFFLQVIQLVKVVGCLVKVIWSCEEEFVCDIMCLMVVVQFCVGFDDKGFFIVIEVISVIEGLIELIVNKCNKIDFIVLEGLVGKFYQFVYKCIGQCFVKNLFIVGYWCLVGNLMNDFFYEVFFDEIVDKGGQDLFDVCLCLLQGNDCLIMLFKVVVDFFGGWKCGFFIVFDGMCCVCGVVMVKVFGIEIVVIVEVFIENGQVCVYDIWEVIDLGCIVNLVIVEVQVNGVVMLGLLQVLLEEVVYKEGVCVVCNYDFYFILLLQCMVCVYVKIIESGVKMGGIGEFFLLVVLLVVVNVVLYLIGQCICSMLLLYYIFKV